MRPLSIMLIAGEASGDQLAAELAIALRHELLSRDQVYTPEVQPLRTGLAPRFFGAGGPRMAQAGVEIAFDLTRHSVIGITDVLRKYATFRKLFNKLLDLATQRQPHVIVGVDYGGFNLRFAHAIRKRLRAMRPAFNNWNPKLVQFVSPQVWASRSGRAFQMAKDLDAVLSIFPFEEDWYARRVPALNVIFVGHPLVDRYQSLTINPREVPGHSVVLLPGSRPLELKRHLPVMIAAFERMRSALPDLRGRIVLPDESLVEAARAMGIPAAVQLQAGGLMDALADAHVAISKTGTVTLECAFSGIPAVTLYKTSWRDYQIGKRIVKVKTLTMPNLLVGENVFPEFIQDAATPENLANAALDLLRNPERRRQIQARLRDVVSSLGPPGAIARAARVIAELAFGAQDDRPARLSLAPQPLTPVP